MPSTTIIGSLESDRLLEPRIRIRLPVPVVPPDGSTWTPGARALSRSARFVGAASSTVFAASIVATEWPSSRLICSAPVAVTTTASSGTAASDNAKSTTAVSPAATLTGCDTVAYPMSRTCTV